MDRKLVHDARQIAEAVKVTRTTVLSWRDRGLLPAPEILHLGNRGKSSQWPLYTIPLAVFVKDALERRFSFAQLARMVGPLIAASRATWVSEEVAKGRTIESLIQELARLPPEHA